MREKINIVKSSPIIDKTYSNFLAKDVKRVVCPNFGHPALTSSFTKCKFLQVNNSFATIVNGLSVLKFVSASEW